MHASAMRSPHPLHMTLLNPYPGLKLFMDSRGSQQVSCGVLFMAAAKRETFQRSYLTAKNEARMEQSPLCFWGGCHPTTSSSITNVRRAAKRGKGRPDLLAPSGDLVFILGYYIPAAPTFSNFSNLEQSCLYTFIIHFHFHSVFNILNRTRQYFCMNYIDNACM